MADEWRADVERLFQARGQLTPDACPGLVAFIAQWTTDAAVVDSRRMGDFIRCVLWNADRREPRPQTGTDWSETLGRRSLREAVLGFLFLPRMDESVGLPRSEEAERLVRQKDPFVMPHGQAHRQRWAALRKVAFLRGEEAATSFLPATLFEYGRRDVAAGRYQQRLIDDIERILADHQELVVVLTDAFPLHELKPEWVEAFQDVHESAPINRFAADHQPRGVGTSELDRNNETHHDESKFLGDLGTPSGSIVRQGTSFTAGWRLKNAGTVPWINRRLLRLTPHTSAFPTSPVHIPIPDTLPGEEVDIVVELTTTHLEGSSEVRFKMVDEDDNFCFPDRYSYGLGITIITMGARRR